MKTSRQGYKHYYDLLGTYNQQNYLDNRCGSTCENCNIKYPIELLCFHHPDPSIKVFEVNGNRWRGVNGPKQETLDEAVKCIVLCRHCHDLEHIAWRNRESIINDPEAYSRYRNHRVKKPQRCGDYMDGWSKESTDRRISPFLTPIRSFFKKLLRKLRHYYRP